MSRGAVSSRLVLYCVVSMAIRLNKPWRALGNAEVASLPGQLGVYEIADGNGGVRFIGMAGGRSLFGLRGELQRELDARGSESRRPGATSARTV